MIVTIKNAETQAVFTGILVMDVTNYYSATYTILHDGNYYVLSSRQGWGKPEYQ